MSSFIAHSLIGFTLGAQKQQTTIMQTVMVSLFFIVLASTPDVDYIINWLRGYRMPIRYTHSVGFVFGVGVVALLFRQVFFRKSLAHVPAILFFFAPATHLVLDGLVAVHGNPYLYPFSSSNLTFPVGILPSSGRLDIHNYYFWRNASIELLIFIPIVVALTPRLRQIVFKYRSLKIFFSVVFIIGLAIGWNLQR